MKILFSLIIISSLPSVAHPTQGPCAMALEKIESRRTEMFLQFLGMLIKNNYVNQELLEKVLESEKLYNFIHDAELLGLFNNKYSTFLTFENTLKRQFLEHDSEINKLAVNTFIKKHLEEKNKKSELVNSAKEETQEILIGRSILVGSRNDVFSRYSSLTTYDDISNSDREKINVALAGMPRTMAVKVAEKTFSFYIDEFFNLSQFNPESHNKSEILMNLSPYTVTQVFKQIWSPTGRNGGLHNPHQHAEIYQNLKYTFLQTPFFHQGNIYLVFYDENIIKIFDVTNKNFLPDLKKEHGSITLLRDANNNHFLGIQNDQTWAVIQVFGKP